MLVNEVWTQAAVCPNRPNIQMSLINAPTIVPDSARVCNSVPTNFMFTAYVIDYANMTAAQYCSTIQSYYSVFFSVRYTDKSAFVSIGTRKNLGDGKLYIDVAYTDPAGVSTVYPGIIPLTSNRFFFSVRNFMPYSRGIQRIPSDDIHSQVQG